MQKWIIINESYLDYLRKDYESRIPRTDYGEDKMKPFFGTLMTVGDLVYVTQVSSAKSRHQNLKSQLDFYKIYRGDSLISVINLNYMFPVPKSEISTLEYSKLSDYVKFSTEKKKSDYVALLKYELYEIQKLPLEGNAKIIYNLKYENPEHNISRRSFDFKHLEVGASYWIEHNAKSVEENKTETTV